ncbi:aminotransferase class I/II-fold pyridoxal phosphate-dependent enzyme [bacterium]|nr:aminotransferase class I/II-fold pyridoxal phosphate-dependent enzyme [bacterium]
MPGDKQLRAFSIREAGMAFSTIRYMEWAKTREVLPGEIDLAVSNMPTVAETWEELGIDPSEIPPSGPNSYGYEAARRAIADRYDVRPEEVMHTMGASMSNFVFLAAMITPGDRILVERPVYECLSAPVEALGGVVVPLVRREKNGWRIPVEDAREEVRNGAKGIFLSNPHNPSGQFSDDDEILRLADAVGHEPWILVDEIYREWLDNHYRRTIALKRPNLFVTSSLTKVFGLPHLRAGWLIARDDIIRKAYRALDHMAVVQPFMYEWVTAQVMRDDHRLRRFRDDHRSSTVAARAVVDEFLGGPHGNAFSAVMPDEGGFAFWRLRNGDGDRFRDKLQRQGGVGVAPGRYFGTPNGFRISWTGGVERARSGLAAMGRFLDEHWEG